MSKESDLVSSEAVRVLMAKPHSQRLLGYLCGSCAENLNGNWPDGHVATFHMGECTVCHRTMSLAAPSDWQLNSRGEPYPINSLNWD